MTKWQQPNMGDIKKAIDRLKDQESRAMKDAVFKEFFKDVKDHEHWIVVVPKGYDRYLEKYDWMKEDDHLTDTVYAVNTKPNTDFAKEYLGLWDVEDEQ